jgi:hypothetical protein
MTDDYQEADFPHETLSEVDVSITGNVHIRVVITLLRASG